MDFFDSQDNARRKTKYLVIYFVMAVLGMIGSLYLVAVLAQAFSRRGRVPFELNFWQPELLFFAAGGTLLVISLGSLYKTSQLRHGGGKVAESLGGRRLNPSTTDYGERRLLNVVEEMALAAGTPVPPVYLLDDEASINAFAAGHTPGDAVIGINRGTIDQLSRDELQGVIAHEFSHILNGDMRLNLRLMGVLHGILMFAIIGYYMMRFAGLGGHRSHRSSSSRDGKGSSAMYFILIGLAMMAIGYLGLFFARLIKAAVSRQREYLADASAVQFTRNPGGIGGALKKIGALSYIPMVSPEAESASHMFFGRSRKSHVQLMSTHPPLVDRIQRVDPNFNGDFTTVQLTPRPSPSGPTSQSSQGQSAGSPLDPLLGPMGAAGALGTGVLGAGAIGAGAAGAMGLVGSGGGASGGSGSGGSGSGGSGSAAAPSRGGTAGTPIDAVAIASVVGLPKLSHVRYARDLLARLPEEVKQAVHDPFSSRAVVLALLLDEDAEIRSRQLEVATSILGDQTSRETLRFASLIAAQGEEVRLPLAELVQPTLQGLSPKQYASFRNAVSEFVTADGKIDLFEFALQRVLIRRLDRHFSGAKPPVVTYMSINGLVNEMCELLSTLAHFGSDDPANAKRAFAQAADAVGARKPMQLKARSECSLKRVGKALDKLELAAPVIKKRALNASAIAVNIDGHVTLREAELLRTIADSLDCPMPPLNAE